MQLKQIRLVLTIAVAVFMVDVWCGEGLYGDVLEVGAAKTYTTISAAVTAANPGDEIVVDAGLYHEYVAVDKTDLLVRAYADPDANDIGVSDRVIVEGGFHINITSDGTTIVQGFYIKPSLNVPTGKAAAHFSNTAGAGQFKDLVLYNLQVPAFGGNHPYLWNQIWDCTIYNCADAGIFAQNCGISMYNTIIAFNANPWNNPGTYGTYVRYSDWFQNPVDSGYNGFAPPVYDAGNNIESDPLFVSITEGDDEFLWLATDSPAVGMANDGGNMGALPTASGPFGRYCGDSQTEYLPTDINHNCYVDIDDLSILAQGWLKCNDPTDDACN